jgi:hypothetical protein
MAVYGGIPAGQPLISTPTPVAIWTTSWGGITGGPVVRWLVVETMVTIRKEQIRSIGSHDMKAQLTFIADLFRMAA